MISLFFGANVIPEIISPPTRHPVLQHYWFNYAIIPALKKHNPDLFYSPDGFSSLRLGNIPSLLVMHDINFHHYPKHIPYFDSIYLNRYFPRFAKNATRLLTVSEYSKSDIIKNYNIPPDKIDVAFNGANEIFKPLPDEEKTRVKKENTNGCDYFIYVGVLVPRKNIVRMLQAYENFRKPTTSHTKLIIVGEEMCLTAEMKKAHSASTFKNDIIFTGSIPSEKLKDLMGAALSLVFVSYFEGFGIPIVEAMNAGIPVITSNVTSMPEIAGDAALLVDPFSVESIANAMISVEKDPRLRRQLIDKGNIRKEMFSWDKSAAAVWKSIEKTLSESKRT
jgi:glycosyltransferase involved in cell wall biosynthesis